MKSESEFRAQTSFLYKIIGEEKRAESAEDGLVVVGQHSATKRL